MAPRKNASASDAKAKAKKSTGQAKAKTKAKTAGAKSQGEKKKRKPRTLYSTELGERICSRLAAGETLIAICRDEDMPDESAVRAWALNPDHEFYPKYTRARELGYHRMADEIVEITDDGRNDWMERLDSEGKGKGWVLNGEHVARSKLRAEKRQWLLSKALPKIYGDKLALTDPDGGALTVRFSA